jgi:transposase-like protein
MDRETVEEIKRHFGVVAEQLRSDVRAVAEGQQALQAEMRRELSAVRTEVARESEETRALIRLSYGEIDRRVRSLETELAELRARLERVESRLAS